MFRSIVLQMAVSRSVRVGGVEWETWTRQRCTKDVHTGVRFTEGALFASLSRTLKHTIRSHRMSFSVA